MHCGVPRLTSWKQFQLLVKNLHGPFCCVGQRLAPVVAADSVFAAEAGDEL